MILQAKEQQDWQEMLNRASDWANADRQKVDAHQYKGEALVMMAQANQDDEEAITLCNKGRDCLQKALGLCTGQREPKEKEQLLEYQIRKSDKVKYFR